MTNQRNSSSTSVRLFSLTKLFGIFGRVLLIAVFATSGLGITPALAQTDAPAETPTIATVGTLTEFSSLVESPSAEQSYSVSASALSAELLITAPAGFEISITSGADFASSLVLAPDENGRVADTTIYVHFKPTSGGVTTDAIIHTSTNANQVDLAVSGSAADPTPVATETAIATATETTTATATETATATDEPLALSGMSALSSEEGALSLTLPTATWTAYNDCSGTTSINYNTTFQGVSGTGTLKNFATGATLTGVTATFTSSGSPTLQTSSGAATNAGTDAYTIFNGKVNMVGVVNYGNSSGWYIDLTISGLNSSKTYTFVTTANRDDSDYTARISRYTISDITSATNASSSGVTVNSNESVSIVTGYNTVNGYVASWTGIQPGTDGDFKVRADYPSEYHGYGFSVFMLAEEDSISPSISTNVSSLSGFSTPVGTPSPAQSYTVTGANLSSDITVTPPTGFEVSSTETGTYASSMTLGTSGGTVWIRETGVEEATYTAVNVTHTSGTVTASVALTGAVIQYYTLSTNPGTHGTITLNPTGGTYAAGTVVTVTATGNSGFAFSDWSGSLTGSTNPEVITMDGNKTVNAAWVVSLCTDLELVAAADTSMRSGSSRASYNYGGSTTVRVNPYYVQGGTDDQLTGALFLWNLSSIPAGSTIEAASLKFYVTDVSTYAYNLYDLKRTWVEGTRDGATGTGASWNYYGAGTGSWGTTGAQGTDDRNSTNLWGATTTTFNTLGNVTVPLNASGLSVVQGWYASSATNYGLTIQDYSGTASNLLVFASKENTSGYTKPTLIVRYCVPPTGPVIETSGTLTAFSTVPGSASAAQTYSVSGSNLEDDIEIAAPAGFELSMDDGSSYHTTLTIPQTGGSASDTISVRLANSLVEAEFAGAITHTSGDADQVDVAVTGSVKNQYTLITSTTPTNGNTITLNPSGGIYYDGTVVTLTAVADSGFEFKEWAGDLSGTTTNPTTITMNENKIVEAIFEPAETCSTVNLVPSADLYLSGYSTSTNNNYGVSDPLKVTLNTSSPRGDLFQWDLSSIPSSATITSASLTLNVTTGASATYNLYNMRRAWVEGSGSGDETEDGATWGTYDGSNSWEENGAAGTISDRYDTNLWGAGSSSFSSAGSKTVAFNSNGVEVVQGWINDSVTNFGLTMQNYASSSNEYTMQFNSSENGTLANRPKLNVTYCVPTADYTLTVGNDGHGTVTIDPVQATYEYGTVVTITPIPASGYEFGSWGGDDAEDPIENGGDSWLITMDGNKSIVANFSLLPINVPPNQPVLVQPADDATGVSNSPSLEVTVSDGNTTDTSLDVSFYGRPVGGSAGDDFTLIAIPDTQNHAQSYPSVMYSMFDWIADNVVTNNIVFATSMGDIVNVSSSTDQWVVADTSYDYLDAVNLPYSVGPGNHDLTGLYENYFGVSRFTGKSWYQGHYGSDNLNNYSFFSASGNDFIMINLQYSPSAAILNWADGLLKANPTRRGIVEQHNILNTTNTWNDSGTTYTALKDNPNLFLILCGHMHTSTDGSAYRSELGDDGHTIHVLMTDYQDYNATNNTGYLRILRFSPTDDKIYAEVYSPYANKYLTDTSNYESMEMVYNLSNGSSAAYTLLGTDEDVANGANATFNWAGRSASTQYEWYATVTDGTETTTGSTWSFTTGSGANTAPVLAIIGSKSVNELVNLPFTAAATDDGLPAGSSLAYSLTGGTGGAVPTGASINATSGAFSWTPTEAQGPGAYTFDVCVSDTALSDCETITVTVNEVNIAPTDIGLPDSSIAENAAANAEVGTLSTTDPDNGNTFTYTLVSGEGSTDNGSFNISGSSLRATASLNFESKSSYTIRVRSTDQGGLFVEESFTITVTNVNEAPVITEGTSITVNMSEDGSPTAFAQTLNVTDVDTAAGSLTWSVLTPASNGSVSASGTGLSKAIGYTPTANYYGSDSFVVQVSDGSLTDTITVNITIASVADAPVITENTSITVNMSEDGSPTAFAQTLNVTDVDTAAGSLTWSITTPASHGTASASGTGLSKAIGYTPTANYYGSDSFVVQVSDGSLTDTITVNVTINPVNDAPVITEDTSITVNMSEDGSPTAFALTLNVTDVDTAAGSLTWSITTPASNGSATASGTGLSNAIGYTPTANYNGSDSFVVQVSDGSLTDTITVNVTINPVNDAPVITEGENTSVGMSKNGLPTAFSLTLHATDGDLPANTLTWSITGAASNGTASVDGTGLSKSISYTPSVDFVGSDAFTVQVADGAGGTDSILVNVTVSSVTQTISGNAGVAGATLTYDGGSTTANSSGVYSITVPYGWAGTVTPSMAGYTFIPTSTTYPAVTEDKVNQNYTAIGSSTQDIALSEGWNMVSFYVHPNSTAIADVLATISGNYDLGYVWVESTSEWLKFDNVPASIDDITALDNNVGFWIHMTAADTLTVTGTEPATTTLSLTALSTGWNLVSYPRSADGSLPTILTGNGVTESPLLVYTYKASDTSDPWKLYDSSALAYANDLTSISAGLSYWIKATGAHSWVVNK